MTTATKITLIRIFLIPVFLVTMYLAETRGYMLYISLGIFAIASITDLIDGEVARRCHQVSTLGKFLDPLADKVLVIAAMAMFCEWGIFPAWALMIVLAREFAVSGLRMVASGKGNVIAAGWSGKVKTAVTMICLCGMLAFNGAFFKDLLGEGFVNAFNWISVIAISATTIYSGVEYFIRNKSALKQ